MLHARRVVCVAVVGGLLWGLAGLSARSAASGPQLVEVQFPNQLPTSQAGVGSVVYRSPAGLDRLQFDVVDGRFARVEVPVSRGASQGSVSFSLQCTSYGQRVSLRLRAWDQRGRAGPPRLLTFTCGQPPRYDFSRVLASQQPIGSRVRLNFFLVDDGVTALTEGATPGDDPLWLDPAPAVRAALEREVLPALSGIWDQCGLGFELGQLRALEPDRLQLGSGTLADRLFSQHHGERVILHGAQSGLILQLARRAVQQHLQEEGVAWGPLDLAVFVVGARVLTSLKGALVDVEGFGEVSPPTYTLVRWGAIYDQDGAVLPRQVVATLAHELGHNMGLGHPGSDGLSGTSADADNLMKGSGVTPEPRAHLLASQCGRVSRTLDQLEAQVAAGQGAAGAAGATSTDQVQSAPQGQIEWVGVQEGQALRQTVTLKLTTSGLSLGGFGFAEFDYSTDGEHFVEIGLDRTPQDGFQAAWDTGGLPNGRYLLRATVTDSQRQRATASLWVVVQN